MSGRASVVTAEPSISVRRVPVPTEPLVDGGFDYADAFELTLDRPDAHASEQWVRTALEEAALRPLILLVHRHVLRFRLGPQDDEHILGWRIVSSTHDVLHLTTGGSLGRAVIVARRTAPEGAALTTFVFFDRPAARWVWRAVGPLHRRIAPYLLGCAARSLAGQGAARP